MWTIGMSRGMDDDAWQRGRRSAISSTSSSPQYTSSPVSQRKEPMRTVVSAFLKAGQSKGMVSSGAEVCR